MSNYLISHLTGPLVLDLLLILVYVKE